MTSPARAWTQRISSWRYQFWLAALGYLLLALYMTAPASAALTTRFIGGEAGDVYASARHAWWVKTALQRGADIFQHELLAYPQGSSALQLWANPLAVFPVGLLALYLPLTAAVNLGVLLTLAGNGAAMYLLARRMLGGAAMLPAFVAGAVYLAFPAIQGQLLDGHLGALAQWQLPLLLICLYSFADAGGKRRYLRVALAFVIVPLGSMAQIAYALAPLMALFLLARWLRRDYVGVARALAVALGGCALLLLYLSPVLGEALSQPQPARSAAIDHSLDLARILKPPPGNPLAGESPLAAQAGAGSAYVGLAGGLLALVGCLARRASRWWLLLAGVAWILALGPLLRLGDQVLTVSIAGYETVVPLPYAVLMELPFFDLAWQPARFMLLFAAALAILAGFGAAALWRARPVAQRSPQLRLALALALALLVIADYRLGAEFPSLPADIPQAIQDLARRSDIRAVYNAPYDHATTAGQALYLQTAHGKPIFAGRDLRDPAADSARLELLSSFEPSLLWEAGADVVILHRASLTAPQFAEIARRARRQLSEPIYQDQRFSVYETPFSRQRPPLLQATRADENTHITYIYKAQPGWLEFNARLQAVNRRVKLSLNGTLLDSLDVNGTIPLSLPLPIARRGYQRFVIALDPPCPAPIDSSLLRCRGLDVALLGDIRVLSSGAIYDPARMEDGIVLAGYHLPEQADEELAIRFWWRFENPRSTDDVRFVHLLDAAGRPVPGRQNDKSLGAMQAGDELTETVRFDTGALPAGEYRVLTGWYGLPDAIRYDVLSNVPGAQDDTIVLGAVRIGE